MCKRYRKSKYNINENRELKQETKELIKNHALEKDQLKNIKILQKRLDIMMKND